MDGGKKSDENVTVSVWMCRSRLNEEAAGNFHSNDIFQGGSFMKRNIGTYNSMFRIAGGLTLLSYATAKMAREGTSGAQLGLAFLGAQKVGEGVTYYCPVADALNLESSKFLK